MRPHYTKEQLLRISSLRRWTVVGYLAAGAGAITIAVDSQTDSDVVAAPISVPVLLLGLADAYYCHRELGKIHAEARAGTDFGFFIEHQAPVEPNGVPRGTPARAVGLYARLTF
jgi:hypothetical protein